MDNMRNILLLISVFFSLGVQAQDTDILLANEYYINGEYQKALDLYSQAAKRKDNIPLIHPNYFSILLELKDYKAADKYLNKVIKAYPNNISYQIDRSIVLDKEGKIDAFNKSINNLIERYKTNQFKLRTAAQYLQSKQYIDKSIDVYIQARNSTVDNSKYALELANLYNVNGDSQLMMEEYLNFASEKQSNLNYVKKILQNIIVDEEYFDILKQKLIYRIQKETNSTTYSDLLIWLNLQEKNFFGAFIQAKAYDKRFNTGGAKIFSVGNIALDNQSYEDAIDIFDYLSTNYPNGRYYVKSKRLLLKSKEEKIKNTYPVNKDEIYSLIEDYDQLVSDIGINITSLQALRSKAHLYAFYLNELDKAIDILTDVIESPQIDNSLRSECKLDLGDIYLLKEMPWESTLYYAQVEKTNKDSKIAYLSKLKNAKLNYYTGNFALAKDHIDILKLATTREIANDALAMSILINDNTILSETDTAMKEFASIELLVYQNKLDTSIARLKQMLKDYPGHSLTDEIYWKLADIYLTIGSFNKSIKYLEAIHEEYNYDIYSDDAYFLTGKIYEERINDTNKAQAVYKDFLTRYPGSIYTAEARKRLRSLRGDFSNKIN